LLPHTHTQINDYMRTFEQYSFLWKEDLQAVYARFMSTNPTLEAFEAELKKWVLPVGMLVCAYMRTCVCVSVC